MPSEPGERPSPLQRVLRLVTDVRAGEAGTALVLTVLVFLLLTAYYVIKPVREALILRMASGAEYKSYLSGAIAIALLFLVPAYARFADRVKKLHLVIGTTAIFASNLLLFYAVSFFPAIASQVGLVFFVWVGIFNMMVVAQFWAFANDLYTEEQGKRLFPMVALGASLGAALGSKVAAILIAPFGVFTMLLLAAGILAVTGVLFVVAKRLAKQSPATSARARMDSLVDREDAAKRASTRGAFAMIFRTRYLLLIALFSLVYNFVNTNGEYLLSRLVKQAAEQAMVRGELTRAELGEYIGAFYGDFYFYVNVLGVILQMFVVSRVVRYAGIGPALFVLPVIAFGNALAVTLVPVLAVLRLGKVAENATDYSLNNTVRQMLWLPTTTDQKFKAKQGVDTFFVRMGDVASAVFVYAGAVLLDLAVRGFAIGNLVLVLMWMALVWGIAREHARLSRDAEPQPAATVAE